MAERITKCHLIGSEGFWSIWINNFEIRNLYVKYIMFVCSLPTSTSVMGEQGMRTESRELAAGMDRNSGIGAGLERIVT
jgi:hypothetical protein